MDATFRVDPFITYASLSLTNWHQLATFILKHTLVFCLALQLRRKNKQSGSIYNNMSQARGRVDVGSVPSASKQVR